MTSFTLLSKNYWAPLFICLLILTMSGCIAVGPDYEKTEPEMPDAWHSAVKSELEADRPELQTWWMLFNDPTLDRLINQAATNNLTLKAAIARIEQAAALRGVSASQYFPDLSANGGVTAYQNTSASTPAGTDRNGEMYQAGLAMAWELDLWGRIRRSVESAEASLQADTENYRDLLVVLNANIATAYINIRTLQQRIQLAEGNLERQHETLQLTQNRFNSGLSPALDVSQAELNLSRTSSFIPPLKQQLTETINRLCVLVGEMPHALEDELSQPQPIPQATPSIVAGIPTDLLRQRPDIRRAERELAAQHAKIGATKANLFPTLTLPGTLTLQSTSAGDLFDGTSGLYSFGPQLRWNLFNGRRIRNQVDAEVAGTKMARLNYEQTVLLALEEVEDAMAAYANEQDRIQSLEAASAAAEKSTELVSELYRSGLTDFQNMLTMEQAQLTQQDELAVNKGLLGVYLAQIYKSLGGGWNMETAQ